MLDHDHVPVATHLVPGIDHVARRRGEHRRADGRGHVDTFVRLAPARAKARGQPRRGHRPAQGAPMDSSLARGWRSDRLGGIGLDAAPRAQRTPVRPGASVSPSSKSVDLQKILERDPCLARDRTRSLPWRDHVPGPGQVIRMHGPCPTRRWRNRDCAPTLNNRQTQLSPRDHASLTPTTSRADSLLTVAESLARPPPDHPIEHGPVREVESDGGHGDQPFANRGAIGAGQVVAFFFGPPIQ